MQLSPDYFGLGYQDSQQRGIRMRAVCNELVDWCLLHGFNLFETDTFQGKQNIEHLLNATSQQQQLKQEHNAIWRWPPRILLVHSP